MIRRANQIDLQNRLDVIRSSDLSSIPSYQPLLIQKTQFNPDQELYIVRDDYLPGGTKSRVAYPFIQKKIDEGYREFVYISPWNGAACIALALVLRLLQREESLRCTVFIDEYILENELPPFIKIGRSLGAKIIKVNQSEHMMSIVKNYCKMSGGYFIEPGFNDPEVIDMISKMVQSIKDEYGSFDEVWCAVGSGTLIKGLKKANLGERYYGVCIFGRVPSIIATENIIPIIHPQNPNVPVKEDDEAPYRSAIYYDSKVFKYVKNRPGKILLWNVI